MYQLRLDCGILFRWENNALDAICRDDILFRNRELMSWKLEFCLWWRAKRAYSSAVAVTEQDFYFFFFFFVV